MFHYLEEYFEELLPIFFKEKGADNQSQSI